MPNALTAIQAGNPELLTLFVTGSTTARQHTFKLPFACKVLGLRVVAESTTTPTTWTANVKYHDTAYASLASISTSTTIAVTPTAGTVTDLTLTAPQTALKDSFLQVAFATSGTAYSDYTLTIMVERSDA